MERYNRMNRRNNAQEKTSLKVKLIRQSIVCAVIFATVFTIGMFNTDTASNISNKVKDSLSYTVDYETTVKNILSAINKITKGIQNNDTTKTD